MVIEEAIQLEDLLEEFERWLKKNKGITGYEGAARQRDRIRREVRGVLENAPAPLTARSVHQVAKGAADKVEPSQWHHPIRLFLEFFESEYYDEQAEPGEIDQDRREGEGSVALMEPTGAPGETLSEGGETPTRIIGRVALTFRTPAKPTQWHFWVRDDADIHLEPGQLVTAENENGDSRVTVTGIVTDVQVQSDIETVADSFYRHGYGDPEQRLPTRPTVITMGEVETVFRSDGRAEPIRGSWQVRFARAEEISKAYGADIEESYQVIGGFTYDYAGKPVMIPFDVRYLLGYEAAHVNIAGASGAATKTSYGLFLLLSLLAYAQSPRAPEGLRGKIAAIAFNVKEADLMDIDNLPNDRDDAKKRLQAPRNRGNLRLWETLWSPPDGYSIDPWRLSQSFKFFAPERRDGRIITSRQGTTKGFAYGCMDLVDSRSLHMLLDPRDLDDLSMAVISDLTEYLYNKPGPFWYALRVLRQAASRTTEEPTPRGGPSGRRDDWVSIGQGTHHRSTVLKVLNRLENAVMYQLEGLLNRDDTRANPIPIGELRGGELWVIDISKIHDKGQRLVFHSVVRTVYRLLEAKRTGEERVRLGTAEINIHEFPNRVVLLVDELNKFAPSGKENSAIKQDIVEIAARGRSVGLALIGIQQLASKVDDEVLTNSNTLVVGRTHAAEIRDAAYNWLPAGLKDRAIGLDKGRMLVWHAAHKRPVFVHFPVPLHCLLRA
jgi:DNA helicase HerA-like ATPase